jgi:hypothetical protein
MIRIPPRERLRSRLVSYLIVSILVSTLVGFMEWMEYHVNGVSLVFHIIDPRCARSTDNQCLSLDHTNLPWNATIATWMSWVMIGSLVAILVFIACYCVLSLLLVLVNVIAPRDRSASMRVRLANSRWLHGATLGMGFVLILCVIFAALWAQLGFISIVVVILMVPAIGWVAHLAERVNDWGCRYRFDQLRARDKSLMRAAYLAGQHEPTPSARRPRC